LLAELRAGDHVVIMSNGSFQGLQRQLLAGLELRPELVS
jgi:UDP-N-acetylmuramate-alanine ligase